MSLLKRINEADAFDVKLNPEENDRLELVFNFIEPDPRPFFYGFRFHKGKWIHQKHDPFELMSTHKEVKAGFIKNALKEE